jgi:hypothetical protein
MTLDGFYVEAVAWVFSVSNACKMLTYLPMVHTLSKPGASADGQNELTWFLWVVCNVTTALYAFELAQRSFNALAIFSILNALMCLWCWGLIRRVRARHSGANRHSPHTSPQDQRRRTGLSV